LYSKWLKPSDFAVSGSFASGVSDDFKCFRTFALINEQNLYKKYADNSLILVYSKRDAQIEAVPTADSSTRTSFTISPNATIFQVTTKGSSKAACDLKYVDIDKDYEFRYVIVPGAQQIGPQSLNSASSLKNLPYAEIRQRFGIPD